MILYNYFVKKNPDVQKEYERYVMEHIDEHKKHRLAHWIVLWKLNWHYRVKKRTTPLLTIENKDRQKKKKSTNKRTPYLGGSESKLHNNVEAHYIAKDLLKYDVISFDIFDTLIFRPFGKPADLFYLIGEKLNIDGFRKIRMNAEAEAREYATITKGNREVTIYDIYKIVNIYTGIDVELGVQTEIEIELNLCFANPQMKRVFNLLKYQGKRIILTSDMYLSSETIEKLLQKCGYYGYEKIFVSCEYQCSKRSGELYLNVLKYLGDNITLMHIGDNHETDVEKPREYGIDSRFYKNVNNAGNIYRPSEMSELVKSAYSGIVNTHLHNGIKKYSPYYEYGYICGGIYIFGFCNWIKQFSLHNEVDRVIFLSRDGSIYKKIYDEFFGTIPSEYLHWSRVANIKYSIDTQYGKEYFLTRAVDDRVNEKLQRAPITISELLTILDLTDLEKNLAKESLRSDMLVVKDIQKQLKMFFHNNWSEIVKIYAQNEYAIKEYVQKKIAGAKKVAIIDVGWNGTGPLGLKYIIENKWRMDCKVECLLAGSKTTDNIYNINRLQNNNIHAYMFSRTFNRDNYTFHKSHNAGMNSPFFEIFTQACEPSFSGLTIDGKFTFEIPEVENYEMIREIHKGIFDFSYNYFHAFAKYPYLYNISGYDAYCPFKFMVENPKLINEILADFLFARNVGNSMDGFGFFKMSEINKITNQ